MPCRTKYHYQTQMEADDSAGHFIGGFSQYTLADLVLVASLQFLHKPKSVVLLVRSASNNTLHSSIVMVGFWWSYLQGERREVDSKVLPYGRSVWSPPKSVFGIHARVPAGYLVIHTMPFSNRQCLHRASCPDFKTNLLLCRRGLIICRKSWNSWKTVSQRKSEQYNIGAE